MPYKDPVKAREMHRKYGKAWYHRNAAKVLNDPVRKEKMRNAHKRRWASPEYRARVNKQNAEYSRTHIEGGRIRALRYRNKDRAKARAKHRAWSKSPAGRAWYQARDHARRVSKLSVTFNEQIINVFFFRTRQKKSVTCYYCEKSLPGKLVHFDHLVPLSKGGPHSIENLVVSCPHCNQTKINKPIQEWMRLGQQVLAM